MNKARIFLFLGLAVGVGLLAYFLLTLDWPGFIRALQGLNFLPLLGVAGFTLLSTVCRALRWELLLKPNIPPEAGRAFWARLLRCWHALCIGYLGNFIFPAKAGEMLRMFQIHKTLGVGLGNAMAMTVMDRLLDVCCILLLGALLVATVLTDMPSLGAALVPLAFMAACVVLLIIAVFFRPERFRAFLFFFLSPLPSLLREKIQRLVDQALFALQQIGSPLLVARAFLFSACAFVADVAVCKQLFVAFGWATPLKAALTMEISLCVAGSLPSAPGYIGLYQAAAVFVLAQFGGTQEDGVAYALVLQLMNLLLFAAIGGSGLLTLWKKPAGSSST